MPRFVVRLALLVIFTLGVGWQKPVLQEPAKQETAKETQPADKKPIQEKKAENPPKTTASDKAKDPKQAKKTPAKGSNTEKQETKKQADKPAETKKQAPAEKKSAAPKKAPAAEKPQEKKPEAEPKKQDVKPKKEAQQAEPDVHRTQRTLNPAWVKSMTWREIGPTSMGGRIIDLAVVESNPSTFYVGTASGGLWKTTNNGITFKPQFQNETSISIGDVCVSESNPDVVWIGTGENNARNSVSWGDGVYKSVDGGETWSCMGLKDSFQTGRIAIHPTKPDIVYVGALGRLWGENEERGVFKTIDGGKSWEKILYVDAKTGCIDLAMSPDEPETLIACMYERLRDGFDTNDPAKRWGPGSGIYKTSDGGRNWKKLSKGLPTVQLGRVGVQYSRSNPNHVYALIETEKVGSAPKGARYPAYMGVQGIMNNEARLTAITPSEPAKKAGFKIDDLILQIQDKKVATYRELIDQFPNYRSGDKVTFKVKRGDEFLDITMTFGQRPETRRGGTPFGTRLGGQEANAQDEQGDNGFETGGVFMSQDGGESWERVNSLNPRPFYYSQIHVDPSDESHQFVLGVALHYSSDGAKTFGTSAGRRVHSDHHAMWIDPKDGRHVILGCDGGLFMTYDRGENWEFVNHLPLGQFYHIAVDSSVPYNIYGGLQDNGSWGGPSRIRGSVGPTADEWFPVGGGDGFVCRVDPDDPNLIYYESQNGNMGRVNISTGERAQIRPPRTRGLSYRFNWKTPFTLSNHNSKIYYCAGNYVFKSLNQGNGLRRISEEITLTDRGSATALSESPINPDVLYVGTDDGAIWMTKSGGHEWTQLKIPELPHPLWVSSIETSAFRAGACYITLDGHKSNLDAPYVFVTEDYGKTWKSLEANLPKGSTRVLREDYDSADTLYLGTEFGVFVSIDRGKDWTRLNNNLPSVAVHEIAIHPTAGEIVAGTHGRSLWILDVTALRQMTKDVRGKAFHLYKPNTAVNWGGITRKRLFGSKYYAGENARTGAVLTYSLAKKATSVKVVVSELTGEEIRSYDGDTSLGLHTVTWNMRLRARRGVTTSRLLAGRAAPGQYLVTLKVDGKEMTQRLRVVNDPTYPDTTFTLEEEEMILELEKQGDN